MLDASSLVLAVVHEKHIEIWNLAPVNGTFQSPSDLAIPKEFPDDDA